MDSKKSGLLKSVLVLILASAAVLQTGLLWLDGNSGHNFFYYIFDESLSGRNSSLPQRALTPERAAVGAGDDAFKVFYDIDDSFNAASEFIVSAVRSSKANEAEEFLWSDCLNERCLIYSFTVQTPFGEYFSALGLDLNLAPEFMRTFDNIALLPSSGENGAAVYFIDNTSSRAAVYKTQPSEALSQEISSLLNKTGLNFISTYQSGFNIFSGNVFVPQFQNTLSYFPAVKTSSIDKKRMSLMDKEYFQMSTEQYFDKYSSKTVSSEPSGIYTISDASTVVKYYPYDVIEYFNYAAPPEEHVSQGLSAAYYVCMDFLSKDTAITTPYYLSDVKATGDGFEFSFDYYLNNIPMFISGGLMDTAGIEHAIEVVVDNGSVRKYKKYACNFALNTNISNTASVDFLSAVNSAMAVKGSGDYKIDDINLGYYISPDNSCPLSWFVNIDGSTTIIDAGSGELKIR